MQEKIQLKKEILIIEDSKTIVILVTDFLKKIGYDKVYSADTGTKGITTFMDLVNNGVLPIVFLDNGLPDTNANEVMTKLFDIRADVKIILATAEERQGDVVKEALRKGAYMYLQKPIRFDDIKEIIKTIDQEENISDNESIDEREKIDSLLKSSTRISLARISEYAQIPQEKVLAYLKELAKEEKVIQIEKIKEISCDLCESVKITQNFICSSCKGHNFKQGRLVEHFPCGNVSLEESYKNNICPKCHKEIKIIGVDYKTMENYYECDDCGNKFPEPIVNYLCIRCNNSFHIDNARWITSEGFRMKN